MLKLLFDENMSPWVADEITKTRGHYTQHISRMGLRGSLDHEVFQYAQTNDMIVVTLNWADFVPLAEEAEIHAGMIFLEGGQGGRWDQLKDVGIACDFLTAHGMDHVDMTSKILWVKKDGGTFLDTFPTS